MHPRLRPRVRSSRVAAPHVAARRAQPFTTTTRTATAVALALAAALLTACGGDDGGLDFADFRNSAKDTAGRDAVDCGHVAVGADATAVSCCLATNFSRATAAYGTYEQQGIDSRSTTGFATTAAMVVTQLDFDSDPMGQGRSDNGRIVRRDCPQPRTASNACSNTVTPFACG